MGGRHRHTLSYGDRNPVATMIPSRTFQTLALVASAAGAIVGALVGGPWIWLHYACKPLATVLLIGMAAGAVTPVSARYRALVLWGLLFSLAGDVLLMLPVDLFLAGLGAFLVAHLCYMAAFFPGSGARTRLTSLAVFGLFGAANLAGLLPRLPTEMRVPVLAYVAALLLMAGFALARARSLHAAGAALAPGAKLAAIGAAFFVASDTLLAWNRFGGGLPLASLWVLSTYYIAQWHIARSVETARGGS